VQVDLNFLKMKIEGRSVKHFELCNPDKIGNILAFLGIKELCLFRYLLTSLQRGAIGWLEQAIQVLCTSGIDRRDIKLTTVFLMLLGRSPL
jgi:hypothetical protein